MNSLSLSNRHNNSLLSRPESGSLNRTGNDKKIKKTLMLHTMPNVLHYGIELESGITESES